MNWIMIIYMLTDLLDLAVAEAADAEDNTLEAAPAPAPLDFTVNFKKINY